MGMRYFATVDDAASGVSDTLKTMLGILVADTAGHRVRIRSLSVGPADNSPGDRNMLLELNRIDDVSAGTAGTAGSTISAANMGKSDENGPDAVVTGPRNYSVEPTTYNTEPLWSMGMNAHGAIVKEWDEEAAPVANRDQQISLLAASRTADACNITATIEFEPF